MRLTMFDTGKILPEEFPQTKVWWEDKRIVNF